MLNHDELLEHFALASGEAEEAQSRALKAALHAAGWTYHEDALGKLWAVAPEAPRP